MIYRPLRPFKRCQLDGWKIELYSILLKLNNKGATAYQFCRVNDNYVFALHCLIIRLNSFCLWIVFSNPCGRFLPSVVFRTDKSHFFRHQFQPKENNKTMLFKSTNNENFVMPALLTSSFRNASSSWFLVDRLNIIIKLFSTTIAWTFEDFAIWHQNVTSLISSP